MATVKVELNLYDAHYLKAVLNNRKVVYENSLKTVDSLTETDVIEHGLGRINDLIRAVDTAIENRELS